MNVGVEVLKVLGTILGIWLGGYLALERLVEEGRIQSERATQIELVKRFVTDTGDLDDVFRAMTMLVRAGFLRDPEGHLRRAIEKYSTRGWRRSFSERSRPCPPRRKAHEARPARGRATHRRRAGSRLRRRQRATRREQRSDAQIRGLSATGRYNTLVVPGAVSPGQWRQLPDQAATLRAKLDALEKRARDGLVTIGQDTAREISKVRSALAA